MLVRLATLLFAALALAAPAGAQDRAAARRPSRYISFLTKSGTLSADVTAMCRISMRGISSRTVRGFGDGDRFRRQSWSSCASRRPREIFAKGQQAELVGDGPQDQEGDPARAHRRSLCRRPRFGPSCRCSSRRPPARRWKLTATGGGQRITKVAGVQLRRVTGLDVVGSLTLVPGRDTPQKNAVSRRVSAGNAPVRCRG